MDNSPTVWRSAMPAYKSDPKRPKKFCVSHIDPPLIQAAECQPPTAIYLHHLLQKGTNKRLRSAKILYASETTDPLSLCLSGFDTIAAFNYIGL